MNNTSSHEQHSSSYLSAEESANDPLLQVADLCQEVLPIWADQLAAARNTTNNAIEKLSQRFYDLSKRIEAAAGASEQKNNSHDLVSLLNESQSQLSSVITLLNHTVEDKKMLVDAILELAEQSKELNGLAKVVNSIAKETNLVAVNAAIEAAHIGQEGRGFSVVAAAVRRLSVDAGKTGSNISIAVEKVTKAIKKVEEISREFEEKDAQMLTNAESVVESVVTKFGETAKIMSDSALNMQAQGKHIKNEIDDVLISLQFQDRVSQMLGHVQDDINKLHDNINNGSSIDNEVWLDELASTYTTEEQHQIHYGKSYKPSKKVPLSKKSKPVSSSSDDITFF